ncbi:MAG: ferredoxin family protein [Firmicutes bacterium]|jgi:2-oxoglutarate ferredoxin oxidoreductase subunit delta|nr:ferredoxin family protein [Bacillota bacterium]
MARVVFDEELCKGCELCIAFCPRGLLIMAEHFNTKGYHPATIVNEEECNACTYCARMCPEVAIEIYR